ncbi:hypothetical protein BDV59DRAFT_21383 [Aspergillus ambiguus]|uniref:uncharacterized protein n=1 Tax=Aspergillus ambiguus TaxID=176160 RepID=UPI003CCD9B9F
MDLPRDAKQHHGGEMNANATYPLDTSDPLFYVCWRRQTCGWCLEGDVPCSWCAVSSTCVPNRASLTILSPLGSSQICPLGSKERWELRTTTLGCNVSTITFLTAVVSVVATLAVIGLGYLVAWAWDRVMTLWKEDKPSGGSCSWISRLRRRGSRPPTMQSVPGDMETSGGEIDDEIMDPERRPLLDR